VVLTQDVDDSIEADHRLQPSAAEEALRCGQVCFQVSPSAKNKQKRWNEAETDEAEKEGDHVICGDEKICPRCKDH